MGHRAWARMVAVAIVVIALDQITKALVKDGIERGGSEDVVLGIRFVNVRNTGVAFSMFSGGGPLVVIIAFIALGALVAFFLTHLHKPLVWLPTGLLLGGAAGNLIDRIRSGAVTDFIKFPHWPAFNVADISVTLGVLLLLWVMERGGAPERRA